MRKRNAVEGTHSELVRGYGLRRCRYKGRNKTGLQAQFTATACNLRALGAPPVLGGTQNGVKGPKGALAFAAELREQLLRPRKTATDRKNARGLAPARGKSKNDRQPKTGIGGYGRLSAADFFSATYWLEQKKASPPEKVDAVTAGLPLARGGGADVAPVWEIDTTRRGSQIGGANRRGRQWPASQTGPTSRVGRNVAHDRDTNREAVGPKTEFAGLLTTLIRALGVQGVSL